ncbi:MAG: DUF87 domain-containing protein [Acidobacteriota bacterium]|nr:DUF87 domain-containing protein [Acidobacteriota bacterium]
MAPKPEIYEKLGAFYLGKAYDAEAEETTDELVLYDAKDLLTHAVCLGMTGSGKTGLCISLLEEAAIDQVPALIIDPKGDLANLLLTFPDLAPEDFRPWVDEGTARRKDQSPDEFAASQAQLWKNGLASWGQDGERIARLKASADFAVYTPGSEAGLPVSILASFGAPPPEVVADGDLLQERVRGTVSGLLGLLGIDADPLQSREHILLSNLLSHAWSQGQGHDLASLIGAIQHPPMKKIGVFEMESFYPEKDRFGLAMALNNLLAAPGFQSWFSGEPLEIDRLLYTADGQPRHAIFSIAHLSEAERMFFVSLLLNQTLAWMRQRPGSSSLQALLYIDEVFGYMPPVANPPSKQALLTLLKQARAFGLGVMLATQNPVDLDYKGLSNTGTWFLGRLQTERDKERLMDGLAGAADADFDRAEMERLISGLGQRVFLMVNVHEDEPVLFHTRWAMSYLRGPMTRLEIQKLMAERKAQATLEPAEPAAAQPAGPTVHPAVAATAGPAGGEPATMPRPRVDSKVRQVFLPVNHRVDGEEGDEKGGVLYEPHLLATATVHFVNQKLDVEHREDLTLMLPLDPEALRVDWEVADPLEIEESELGSDPAAGAGFGELPKEALESTSYTQWERQLSDTLYRERRCRLFFSPTLKAASRPGEEERDFRIRMTEEMREQRDAEVEELRESYAKRIERLEDRQRRAEQKLEREEEQAAAQKSNAWVSAGTALLGALMGRKKLSRTNINKAGTAFRRFSRSSKESQDVERAEEDLRELQEDLAELNDELQEEIDALEDRFDMQREELEEIEVAPRRRDVVIHLVALAWMPYARTDGALLPAWQPPRSTPKGA